MKRLVVIVATTALGITILTCAGTGGQECNNGSTRIVVNDGKRTTYYCRDGRWVKG